MAQLVVALAPALAGGAVSGYVGGFAGAVLGGLTSAYIGSAQVPITLEAPDFEHMADFVQPDDRQA